MMLEAALREVDQQTVNESLCIRIDAAFETSVGGDPVNGSDPSGMMCWGFCTFTNAAKSVGHFVVKHAAVLSTVAAGLATVAYVGCAVSAGLGCGLGLALSEASTVLSGINTYDACFGGGGGCASAAIGFGMSIVATGAGFLAQELASSALNMANAYAEDIFLARQAGVIGTLSNGLSTFYGIFGWQQKPSNNSCR